MSELEQLVIKGIKFMKKYVVSTEIYRKRLELFQSSHPDLQDLHVKMGLNASTMDPNPMNNEGLKEFVKEPCTWPMGAICCGVAHLEIFKEVIATNSPMTVFEDDAILTKDFDRKTTELLETIPGDWDIVQWGYNWDTFMWMRMIDRNGPVIKIDLCREMHRLDLNKFISGDTPSTLIPLEMCFGMHAYSISPSGAQKILDNFPGLTDELVVVKDLFLEYQSVSLDSQLGALYHQMNSYIAFPPLSYVHNDKSKSAIWNPDIDPDSI
jgi:GR25 family glycosyltransferase involved in LPS biosynthesis